LTQVRTVLDAVRVSFQTRNYLRKAVSMAMRSSRCIFSTATALHRVFIAPIEQSTLLVTPHLPPPRTRPSSAFHQTRCYAAPPFPERRLPHDDLIKSWSVILVNEDGTLGEPRSTYDVLQTIDRSVETLVQVSPNEDATIPICKIMNKKAMREAEKAKAKAASRGGLVGTKTIELNWAIDRGDLGHRLDKIKKFLDKGLKVEIALASKRRGKQATEEEAHALLRRIREVVKEVNGAKEIKPMEGRLLRTATLYIGKLEAGRESAQG
jgi:translation initiation factor IF-3